jgi:mono/diheme cytochrome c family protein
MRQILRARAGAVAVMPVVLLLLALALLAAVVVAAPTQAAGERGQLAARGSVTYRVYCRTCHGPSGRGDGALAELLKVPPSDLTGIARRAGGEFPEGLVTAAIDGRAEVAAHGPREMPIWGEAFGPVDPADFDEAAVQAKIREVVLYLETIQR